MLIIYLQYKRYIFYDKRIYNNSYYNGYIHLLYIIRKQHEKYKSYLTPYNEFNLESVDKPYIYI